MSFSIEEKGISAEHERQIYTDAVRHFGTEGQIIIAIEELAELQQALVKFLRHRNFGQGNYESIVANVAEERADVEIMLGQMKVIFGDNSAVKTAKLERLERLVTGGTN